MYRRRGRLLLALIALISGGCTLGPRSMAVNRLRYNEAVKDTTEQQLLLNIVRLRYADSPSSLSVASIADQHEIVAGLRAIPFFTAAAAGEIGGYRGSVLPQAELSGANRPTLSVADRRSGIYAAAVYTHLARGHGLPRQDDLANLDGLPTLAGEH